MPELTEKNLLNAAMAVFNQQTGLTMTEATDTPALALEGHKRMVVDAFVRIKEYGEIIFTTEIKKWAQHANLGAVIEQIRRLPGQGLLVADYVNPNMAMKLKQEKIQFIDTAGNAYLNVHPLYVFIKGNKPLADAIVTTQTMDNQIRAPQGRHITRLPRGGKGMKTRAFTNTGLKVIYAFLCHPELVTAPYREIAERADVAVGTVGWVITDLKELGFLQGKANKDDRQLRNLWKLLDRWVEAYPENLQPKQFIGGFIADNPYWWKEVDIEKYHGYWGGEIAGAKYTDYLQPEIVTVYAQDDTYKKLILEQRLRPAGMRPQAKGTWVELYKAFWNDTLNQDKQIVHPVLAYADLIATGDTRNHEVARMIYDKYLAQYIEND